MKKDQLRTLYKKRRIDMTADEYNIANKKILKQLQCVDWSKYKYVHIYLAIRRFNEPDTFGFLNWFSSTFPNVNIVLSKSDFETGGMVNFLYTKDTILTENVWGIIEPIEGQIVDEKLIDFVIMPLLAVDKQGNRVGYGRGFYDRLLEKCRTDVQTCGISFFDLVDNVSDIGVWDKKLTSCITPDKYYIFQ